MIEILDERVVRARIGVELFDVPVLTRRRHPVLDTKHVTGLELSDVAVHGVWSEKITEREVTSSAEKSRSPFHAGLPANALISLAKCSMPSRTA